MLTIIIVTLFNLFISDIPDALNGPDCDPVTLHDLKINCLMFADDIVLLSESADGLQNSLYKLQECCDIWLLTVNTQKTKILVMNKAGRDPNSGTFTFNNSALEVVNQYKYLGLMITSSGSFTRSVENLKLRAMKALYKIKKYYLSVGYTDQKKRCPDLFDTLVRPIATCGCEVWGGFIIKGKLFSENSFFDKFNEFPCEKLYLTFCKNLLGVHKKTSNTARFPGSLG